VNGKNMAVKKNPAVAVLEYAELHVFGHVIRLERGPKIFLDDRRIGLGFRERGQGRFWVQQHGKDVVVMTSFGLRLTYDGRMKLLVRVPGTYFNSVQGICGNFDNNVANDFTTKDGRDVSGEDDKYSLLGNSWIVQSAPCAQPPKLKECSPTKIARYSLPDACGKILDVTSSFGACINKNLEAAQELFENCLYDACQMDEDDADEVICDAVTELAEHCETFDMWVDWRTDDFCPMTCNGGTYKRRMNGCTRTCANLDARRCELSDREGCACPDDHVLEDGRCIHQDECGCLDDFNIRRPFDSEWWTDCTHYSSCQRCTDRSCRKPWTIMTEEDNTCDECKIVLGLFVCLNDPCDGNPCGGKGRCVRDKSKDEGFRCRCLPGFRGDDCLEKIPAGHCAATGDPHYKTFEDGLIHFQGACTYTLVETINSGRNLGFNRPHFKIIVKNQPTSFNAAVTVLEYVEIYVYGHVIRLEQERRMYVDGHPIGLGYTEPNLERFSVEPFGTDIRVKLANGVRVRYNGRRDLFVKVPGTYFETVQGICGNFDGDSSNEFVTKQGVDVSGRRNRYTLVGESWLVGDANNIVCDRFGDATQKVCAAEDLRTFRANDHCGILTDDEGVFADCIQRSPKMAEAIFENCVQDSCQDNPQKALCASLEQLATFCETHDMYVDWRTEELCPMNCPAGEYRRRTPGCTPTCGTLRWLLPNARCTVRDREGCVCPAGQVLEGNQCIPVEDCGCVDEYNIRRAFDSDWWQGCDKHLKCSRCTAKTCRKSWRITEISGRCPRDQCKTIRGHPMCLPKMCYKAHWGQNSENKNFRRSRVTKRQECEDLCSETPMCMAFVYVTDKSKNYGKPGNCHLKKRSNLKNEAEGHNLFVKQLGSECEAPAPTPAPPPTKSSKKKSSKKTSSKKSNKTAKKTKKSNKTKAKSNKTKKKSNKSNKNKSKKA